MQNVNKKIKLFTATCIVSEETSKEKMDFRPPMEFENKYVTGFYIISESYLMIVVNFEVPSNLLLVV